MLFKWSSILVCVALCVWAYARPDGYAPYALIGFALGDFAALFWFGVNHGFLEREGDFRFGDLAVSFLCFLGITGLMFHDSAFAVDSERYTNAIVMGACAGGIGFVSKLGMFTWGALR